MSRGSLTAVGGQVGNITHFPSPLYLQSKCLNPLGQEQKTLLPTECKGVNHRQQTRHKCHTACFAKLLYKTKDLHHWGVGRNCSYAILQGACHLLQERQTQKGACHLLQERQTQNPASYPHTSFLQSRRFRRRGKTQG